MDLLFVIELLFCVDLMVISVNWLNCGFFRDNGLFLDERYDISVD